MYKIDRFGKKSVAWRGTTHIKCLNVEDYNLALYIFSDIAVTKITETTLLPRTLLTGQLLHVWDHHHNQLK